MADAPISPPEDELSAALAALRGEHPALGIPKIHALLLAAHPEWAVSEKRTRKLLQNAGLTAPTPAATVYPSSRVIPSLDVQKYSSKIAVRYFDARKGKGLVATQPIAEGEVIWKEDPFIIAPEWEIYDLQQAGAACAQCTTPLARPALVVPCPAGTPCPARFCNRLCLTRATAHPLLCPAQNPAAAPLLAFARSAEWLALHALAQCTARVLLAAQRGDAALAADWDVVRGLAELGMEERFRSNYTAAGEPDRATWQRAHTLFAEALQDPPARAHKAKLARLLRRPVPPDIAEALFAYPAFLRGLGRMSLNLEAHGGLYTLHAHLNHACAPNVSVRHLEQRTALARITLIARAPIAPGDELLVSYVDPQGGLGARRAALRAWGFGVCRCTRCEKEEREGGGAEAVEVRPGVEMEDLAAELKAGLGVL